MITISDEEKVRKLITDGLLNDIEIEKKTGMCHQTIGRLRKFIKSLCDITNEQMSEVRKLLLAKMPIGAVEIETKIPRSKIVAIRRYYFLHKRDLAKDKPYKCPTCKNVIAPKNYIKAVNRKAEFLVNPSLADVDLLCNVISDIINLGNLGIINNPLFYQLARRAGKALERINEVKA